MPRRSRSRSPRRDRRRSRSPDRIRHRDRDRERERERRRSRSPPPPPPRYRSRSPRSPPRGRRSRSRSMSPRRRSPDMRGRSRERDGTAKADKKPAIPERPEVDEEALAGLPPEEADMMRMMGFSSFDSTKGKKVEGNDIYVANVVRKRRYRQYMNRRGGFNRPLDFIA